MAKKSTNKHSNSQRKIIAYTSIFIVIMFIAIIIVGIIRENRPDFKSIVPTDNQLAMARSIVASNLQKNSDNILNYQYTVSNRIKIFQDNNNNSSEILQVCLTNNITKHIYFIDLNLQKILVHAETDAKTTNKDFLRYTRQEYDCHSKD